MKHIYNLFIFLCVSLTLWSCKDSEEIAQASLTLNNNELSFTGFPPLERHSVRLLDQRKPRSLSRSKRTFYR